MTMYNIQCTSRNIVITGSTRYQYELTSIQQKQQQMTEPINMSLKSDITGEQSFIYISSYAFCIFRPDVICLCTYFKI